MTSGSRGDTEVGVSVSDRVATITLNAPERRNALTQDMAARLEAHLEALEGSDEVGAIIVAAAGPAFCAGADRHLLAAADEDKLRAVYRAFLRVRESRLPTIAAVNGPAVGAGLNLALACDIRIASPAARFDTRFLRLGVHCGGGHTWLLSRAVGPAAAAAMLLFGEVVDGEHAARIGLAWQCVPDSELAAAAQRVAAGAASFDRSLTVTTKDSLRRSVDGASHPELLELELVRQLASMGVSRVAGAGVTS